MLGTSQFHRICIGQARISDHTISNSMATNDIVAKIQIDFILQAYYHRRPNVLVADTREE